MKTLIIVVALLLFIPLTLTAQVTGSVELQNMWPKGDEFTPDIEVWLHGPVTGSVNWWAWTLNSRSWGEAYAGIAYAPTTWIEGGVAYGIETADPSGRLGTFLWAGEERWYVICFYEDGGSGPWRRTIGNFYFTQNFGLGAMEQRGLGSGPRLELKWNSFMVWGTMLQSEGQSTASFCGVRYNF